MPIHGSLSGECWGLAVCEMTVPSGFAGPPPHVHYDFDEASTSSAGRGTRHTFANPGDEPVQVLGLWTPGSALTFIEEIGAGRSDGRSNSCLRVLAEEVCV